LSNSSFQIWMWHWWTASPLQWWNLEGARDYNHCCAHSEGICCSISATVFILREHFHQELQSLSSGTGVWATGWQTK